MISKADLLAWLKDVDSRLNQKITLVAVGGTAMTLIGLKPSTIDVDFCLSHDEAEIFAGIVKSARFKVDIFKDGYIFSEQLPEDYLERSSQMNAGLKNIILKALSLEDIIITKAARYNERDEQDISAIAKTGKVDKKRLMERFQETKKSFAGNEEDYEYHFDIILRMHFS